MMGRSPQVFDPEGRQKAVTLAPKSRYFGELVSDPDPIHQRFGLQQTA
jgi:hypothetical protein